MKIAPMVALAVALVLAGCGDDPPAVAPSASSTLTVTSEAFAEGGTIPEQYTCKACVPQLWGVLGTWIM